MFLRLFRAGLLRALPWIVIVIASQAESSERVRRSPQSDPPDADGIVAISTEPATIQLHQRHDLSRVLVTGRTVGGQVVDLTREARFSILPFDLALIDAQGAIQARSDGAGRIRVMARGLACDLPIQVSECSNAREFSFEQDVTPLLNRYGCNSSGCHGKAEGQNGFRLSVFGYDPKTDYQAMLQESRGRRISHAAPARSLFVQKMSGAVPHGGGARIPEGTPEYGTLVDWVAAGTPFGAATNRTLKLIRLSPRERVARFNATQTLRVEATYTDGRTRDVTHLAQFQSNNESVARVDDNGLILTGTTPGQVAIMARYLDSTAVCEILIPRSAPSVRFEPMPKRNFIDDFVARRLGKLNIQPSGLASDSEFLRRVSLDIIGTLPTASEARRFLAETNVNRRARLVDHLLNRGEYVDFWSLKWADLLRVDRQLLGQREAYAYYGWIRGRLSGNVPFDRMVRELVSAEGPIEESPQANFFKIFGKPGDVASALSQALLGVRIACAECHHHPYDRWGQNDYYGMQAFFQPIGLRKGLMGEELRFQGRAEARNPLTGNLVPAHALGESVRDPAQTTDPRPSLAAWWTAPENPWFARNVANRLVAHFLGRGLVEPVDDVRATNPPTDPDLLDALARHVVDVKFDLKEVIRTIADSRTYQLSSHPNETNDQDEQNYSRALFKRLPAEVLLDALCQTTGVPEKFAGVPAGCRAIQLWDSDVSHPFLKLFGRPVRKTACECERNGEASIAQVLHLLNSPLVHAKITHEAGTIAGLIRSTADNHSLLEQLYLTFYSRFPTADERVKFEAVLSGGSRREAAEEIAWSMLNSLEFIFNH